MRKLFLFFLLTSALGLSAIGQSCYKITLTKSGLLEPSCNLNNAAKVYFHSGACSSNANDCNIPDSTWKHIVGNWSNGVGQDDGLGLMSDLGNGVYEFTFDPDVYYGTQANINTTEGGIVMPGGATVYSIGLVFRNEDGTVKGADNTVDCGDIFIRGINTGSPTVVDHFGDAFGSVTLSFCNSLREEITAISSVQIYPNPTQGNVWLDFSLAENVKGMSIKIYNHLGQEITSLHDGFLLAGDHSIAWENSQTVSGVYSLVMESNGQLTTSKMVVSR